MINELYHYGVKGMKWGKRRSKEQIVYDTDKIMRADLNRIKTKYETAKVETEPTKDFMNSTSDALNKASNLANTVSKYAGPSKKAKEEISRMSDKELRDKINRIQMEQQYANLNPSKVSVGANHVATVLSAIGSLAAIGGSIASMAIAIKQLKSK